MSVSGRTNPTPSATSSSNMSTVTNKDGKIRVNKPDEYFGERSKLEDWIVQLELYFLFDQGVKADQKTAFAATFMRGRAGRWIKPGLKSFLENREDEEEIFGKFATFKEHIRRTFGISNEKMVAERTVQHLTQTTSTAEYTAKFQEYSTLTEWDDASLMTMYRRGLKDHVKDELVRTGASIDDLETLMKESIDIDDKWYERAMEKRHDKGSRGRAGTYFGGSSKNRGNPGKSKQGIVDPYGAAPMELDATQKRKGRNTRVKNLKKTKGACYSCGKQANFARDCRSKGVVPTRQFNAMLRRQPEMPEGSEEESGETDSPDEDSDEEYCHVDS